MRRFNLDRRLDRLERVGPPGPPASAIVLRLFLNGEDSAAVLAAAAGSDAPALDLATALTSPDAAPPAREWRN